jgi:hypothetical protein
LVRRDDLKDEPQTTRLSPVIEPHLKALLASADAENARLREALSWIPVSERAPQVKRGDYDLFIGATRRNGKLWVYQLAYCNEFPLEDEDGDEMVSSITGWFEITDFDENIFQQCDPLPEFWQPLPAAPPESGTTPLAEESK